MFFDIGEKFPIIFFCLLMSAAEADRYAQGIRQLLDFTLIVFFVIQHQKYPVISIQLTVFQLFFGYANTHFSKEGQRIRLVFFQTADRIFQIQMRMDLQAVPDSDDPAGFGLLHADLIQLR